MAQHREHDALVASYRHLREMPRANDALYTLQKIASVVKPIMRARGWKVSELCEFYPSEQNLLGKSRGHRACWAACILIVSVTRPKREQGPEDHAPPPIPWRPKPVPPR